MASDYSVACYVCEVPILASSAPWCQCLVTEPTLVCPACSTCFCDAPSEYQRAFWAKAPRGLWEVRRQETGAHRHLGPNVSVAEAKRPLVCLVEDRREMHEIVARAAVSLGCGFVRAEDGRSGLNLARLYRPELILADAELPRLDGREMCRKLKVAPETSASKVILVTAWWWKPADVAEAQEESRADDHLSKPFEFSELIALFKKHVAPDVNPTELRRHPRFDSAVELKLTRLEAREGEPTEEVATAADLGKGGARVPTTLPVGKDELVQVAIGAFESRASVRRVSIRKDGVPELHLWFLDGELPDDLLPEATSKSKG